MPTSPKIAGRLEGKRAEDRSQGSEARGRKAENRKQERENRVEPQKRK
jgi:hypothetical protein